MNVFIVEDENLAVERLMKLLSEIDDSIRVIGVSGTVQDTVKWFQTNEPPDLILMDIELADGQSFKIFNHVEILTPVIFITSYDEHSIRAFKVNSIDYLLKPIRKEELQGSLLKFSQLRKQFASRDQHIARIEQLVNELNQKVFHGFRQRFLVKTGNKYVSLDINDIAYFYFNDRLTFLKTWKGATYVVDFSLDELEKMLDPISFFRANRKYMIHSKSVLTIHAYFNHKLKLQLSPTPDDDVLISKERSVDFKKWMGK